MHDVEPPPFWLKNMRDKFPGFTGRVDRWQIIHYYAPSTICIDVGVARAGTGAPEGDRVAGRERLRDEHDHPGDRPDQPLLLGVHAQLPPRQPADHHSAAAGVQGVFAEDEAMLTAQQAAIDANPDHEFYSLSIDAGGMWVRRILDRMLEAEGAAAMSARAPGQPVWAPRASSSHGCRLPSPPDHGRAATVEARRARQPRGRAGAASAAPGTPGRTRSWSRTRTAAG